MNRKSGILLHISSLPSKYGVGDFGLSAYKFIDFLERSGQKIWQILPLGPLGFGNSPYQSASTFAGNFLFIDIDELINLNYIEEEDTKLLTELETNDNRFVNYELVGSLKEALLHKSFSNFKKDSEIQDEFLKFKEKNSSWLENYSIFSAFKKKFGNKEWFKWKKPYKFKNKTAIEKAKIELKEDIEFHCFLQFFFFRQWKRLKKYSNDKGVEIIGDLPIFVSTDSADTWSIPKIFQFNKFYRPKKIGGCPPDSFSLNGQVWGNILYDWNAIKKENYRWWLERIKFSLSIYDYVRIDHFRGFESYWSIRHGSDTAKFGRWEKGPGMNLFSRLKKLNLNSKIIAEDLGSLTNRVIKLLERSGYPGMKILQFGLESFDNDYQPHKYPVNSIAYTGTHDNNTIVGWYNSLDQMTKNFCDEYLKNFLTTKGSNFWEPINWRAIEAIWASDSKIAIVPMQDILGLDESSRMNIPSTVGANWRWRVQEVQLTNDISEKLKNITNKFHRANKNPHN